MAQLEVLYNDDPGIQMWEVSGAAVVGSRHRKKSTALNKAKKLMRKHDHVTSIQVYKKNGAIQRTIGGGPML